MTLVTIEHKHTLILHKTMSDWSWQQLLYTNDSCDELRVEKRVKVGSNKFVKFERSEYEFVKGLRDFLLEHGDAELQTYQKKNSDPKTGTICTDAKWLFLIDKIAKAKKISLSECLCVCICGKRRKPVDQIGLDKDGGTTGDIVYVDEHAVCTPVHYVMDWQLKRKEHLWKTGQVRPTVVTPKKNSTAAEEKKGYQEYYDTHINEPYSGMKKAKEGGLFIIEDTGEPLLYKIGLHPWEKYFVHSTQQDYIVHHVCVRKDDDAAYPSDHGMHYEDIDIDWSDGSLATDALERLAKLREWLCGIWGLRNPKFIKWSTKNPFAKTAKAEKRKKTTRKRKAGGSRKKKLRASAQEDVESMSRNSDGSDEDVDEDEDVTSDTVESDEDYKEAVQHDDVDVWKELQQLRSFVKNKFKIESVSMVEFAKVFLREWLGAIEGLQDMMRGEYGELNILHSSREAKLLLKEHVLGLN